MADKTKIEWTDATWNPIRGCTRVSEGCRHCYAEGVARRFNGEGLAYEGLINITTGAWNGNIRFVESHLMDPLKWKEPRRIFVNSMSDLFHENVTDEMRDEIFAVMALSSQHTFQVLTKRPERMLDYLSYAVTRDRIFTAAAAIIEGPAWKNRSLAYTPFRYIAPTGIRWQPGKAYIQEGKVVWPLPNVWLGVSVENQKAAIARIPLLLQTPAAVRFLSCEPLLGPLSLRWLCGLSKTHSKHKMPEPDAAGRIHTDEYDGLRELDWVIAGGESGTSARPMHPDWARGLRDQCAIANVPFFFKQWGEWADATDDDELKRRGTCDEIFTPSREVLGAGYREGRKSMGMVEPDWRERGAAWMSRVGKKSAGHLLDGIEHQAFPEER